MEQQSKKNKTIKDIENITIFSSSDDRINNATQNEEIRDLAYKEVNNENCKNTNRRIIYVDASHAYDKSTISLYEKETCTGLILKINNEDFKIKNNGEAESLAIFNAILYIRKKDYNKAIILCDNEGSAKKYANLEKGIRVLWIPREINIIADKLSKLNNNTKQDQINLLKYLFLKIGQK